MLFTFTDFGPTRLYTGQLHAALARVAPRLRIVDLLDDAPAFNVSACGELLRALLRQLPEASTVLAVVDPGVGGARRPLVVRSGGLWLVGPDNGLFSPLAEGVGFQAWEITWRPASLSQTFHGRDLFAPVAARLAAGENLQESLRPVADIVRLPAAPPQVIYLDSYGNCLTNLHAEALPAGQELMLDGRLCPRRQCFEQGAPGEPFCYENSLGLLEIAINQADAAAALGLRVGSPVGLG